QAEDDGAEDDDDPVGERLTDAADDAFDRVGDVGGPVGVGDRIAWHGVSLTGRPQPLWRREHGRRSGPARHTASARLTIARWYVIMMARGSQRWGRTNASQPMRESLTTNAV